MISIVISGVKLYLPLEQIVDYKDLEKQKTFLVEKLDNDIPFIDLLNGCLISVDAGDIIRFPKDQISSAITQSIESAVIVQVFSKSQYISCPEDYAYCAEEHNKILEKNIKKYKELVITNQYLSQDILQISMKILTDFEKFLELQYFESKDQILKTLQVEQNTKQKKLKEDKEGVVYLLKSSDGYYKIGVTINLEQRIKTLNNANPYDIIKIYSRKIKNYYNVENKLHKFMEERKINREWFLLNTNDIEYIINYLDKI